jgi:hypothetical protein
LGGTLLLLSMVPTRQGPATEHYRYAREVERAVQTDLAAGKRVLVSHGAMFHIHAGVREPLLDRSNSVLELGQGGCESLAGTRARVLAHYYDRIYQNSHFYFPSVYDALRRAYRTVTRVSEAAPPFTEYRWGWQFLTPTVQVLEPLSRNVRDFEPKTSKRGAGR